MKTDTWKNTSILLSFLIMIYVGLAAIGKVKKWNIGMMG